MTDEKQIARTMRIWHCEALGVGSLLALSRASQAWERMEGELAEKNLSGALGSGGAWWGLGCWYSSSASPVGQDHCSSGKHQRPRSFLLDPLHGRYPIPSSWLCPNHPAHLPSTSSLLCPPWKVSLPSPLWGNLASVPLRSPHFCSDPASPSWTQLSRAERRLAATTVQPSRGRLS